MRSALLLAVAITAASVFVNSAQASLQSVLDGITTAPVAGTSSINVATDALSDNDDTLWAISGSGGSVATIVIELAGFANDNVFGVYDAADPSKKVQLFSGASSQGDQVVMSIKADGSVFLNVVTDTGIDFAMNCFGYYLTSPEGTFYSDSLLNVDGDDHMLAVQGNNTDTIQVPTLAPGIFGSNEYVLGWEDLLKASSDHDYDDFVVIVESVDPKVPEAASFLIWSGLCMAGVAARRRRTSVADQLG